MATMSLGASCSTLLPGVFWVILGVSSVLSFEPLSCLFWVVASCSPSSILLGLMPIAPPLPPPPPSSGGSFLCSFFGSLKQNCTSTLSTLPFLDFALFVGFHHSLSIDNHLFHHHSHSLSFWATSSTSLLLCLTSLLSPLTRR